MLSRRMFSAFTHYDQVMDSRRIARELDALTTGRVLAGVLSEVGAIPVERQRPELVAEVRRWRP
jgi:hypothetical protein